MPKNGHKAAYLSKNKREKFQIIFKNFKISNRNLSL